MDTWPSTLPRMRDVFVSAPSRLTHDDFERLVAEHAREAEDLDFKREHYERADKGRIGLSTDVVAMANDRGGVIVVGIDDEKTEVAQACTPVSIDGEHSRWLRQVVASHTAPHVQTELVVVPTREDPTRGWIVIV